MHTLTADIFMTDGEKAEATERLASNVINFILYYCRVQSLGVMIALCDNERLLCLE
jgi:hypothetical protein